MKYLLNDMEIILKNVEKKYIEEIFFYSFIFDVKNIISSHFYDIEKKADIKYQEVKSLNEYFNIPGTGSIYFNKVIIGTELEHVLIHIACDEKYGDITVHFEENQFENINMKEIIIKLENLISQLLNIIKNRKINKIILGYEPAEDNDVKLIEICQGKIELFNEGTFESPIVSILHNIARKLNV